MANQATLSAILTVTTKQFVSGIERAEKKLEAFANRTTRAGRDMSVALSGPLILLGKTAVNIAKDFEFAQAKIAGLKGQEKIIKALRDEALRLGEETIFTNVQVSELQLSLAKLGSTTDEIKQLTPTIIKLAQAMDTDLAESGEFVVQTLNKFSTSLESVGDKSAQAAYVANVFAKANAESTLTIDKLRSSLNFSGAEAAAFGFSLAETVSVLAVLSNRGFDASRGGTAFRRILQQLAKDGYNATEALEVLFDESTGFRQELAQYGLRGAGPRSAIAGLIDEQQQLQRELENSSGFLDRFASVLEDTLKADIDKLTSALSTSAVLIADSLAPNLRELIQYLTDLVKQFNEASPATQRFTAIAGAVIAVLGPLTLIFGSLVRLLALVLKPFKLLAGLFKNIFIALGKLTPYLKKFGGYISRALPAVGGLAKVLSRLNIVTGLVVGVWETFNEVIRKNKIDDATEAGKKSVEELSRTSGKELEKLQDDYKELYETTKNYLGKYDQNLDDILSGKKKLDRDFLDTGYISRFLDERAKNEYVRNVEDKIASLKTLKKALDDIAKSADDSQTSLVNVAAKPGESLVAALAKSALEDPKRGVPVLDTVKELKEQYRLLESQISGFQFLYQQNTKLGIQTADYKKLENLNTQLKEVEAKLKSLGIEMPKFGPLFNEFSGDDLFKDAAGNLTFFRTEVGYFVSEMETANELGLEFANIYSDIYGDDEFNNAWGRQGDLIGEVSLAISNLSRDINDLALPDAFDQELNDLQKVANIFAQPANLKELQKQLDYYEEATAIYASAAKEAFSIGDRTLADDFLLQAQNSQLAADNIRIFFNEMEKMAEIQKQVVNFAMTIGDTLAGAFYTALTAGEGFFKGLLKSLLDVFAQLMAKLVALIIAYSILAVLSGGTSVVAGMAANATSNGLGSFVMSGFGLPSRSVETTPGMRGFISGSNIVIAGSRGVTATDRIYG